jgi:hypothetical protein
MSCDTDVTDEPLRHVALSFTAGGQGCWIFVTEGCCAAKQARAFVRLNGKDESVKLAHAILTFYEDEPDD